MNEKLKRQTTPSTRFLKRHILRSDDHGFIGRLYGLGIVTMRFESYEELSEYDDIKYMFDVNSCVKPLTKRVESLNLVGNMLWPEPMPKRKAFPVSLYEWLTASADVFLIRYVSVVDCALQVVNAVFELGLPSLECKVKKLKQKGASAAVIEILGEMLDEQAHLRSERNSRVHEGLERQFTQDDQIFEIAAIWAKGYGLRGIDRTGRKINVERSFKEGLVGLQRTFNSSTRKLIRQLDRLYDELGYEFEIRFAPRIAAATHGFNAGAHRSRS